MREPPNE
jgi:hypothetical protein